MTKKQLVEALLDAAFKELQHDTGPQDPEYIHQRRMLRGRFLAIIDKPWRIQGLPVNQLPKDQP